MLTVNARTIRPKKVIIREQFRCPDCGADMSEVERLTESRTVYIWHECPRIDCDGQWLQRKSLVGSSLV